jgi:hypothetical protein
MYQEKKLIKTYSMNELLQFGTTSCTLAILESTNFYTFWQCLISELKESWGDVVLANWHHPKGRYSSK